MRTLAVRLQIYLIFFVFSFMVYGQEVVSYDLVDPPSASVENLGNIRKSIQEQEQIIAQSGSRITEISAELTRNGSSMTEATRKAREKILDQERQKLAQAKVQLDRLKNNYQMEKEKIAANARLGPKVARDALRVQDREKKEATAYGIRMSAGSIRSGASKLDEEKNRNETAFQGDAEKIKALEQMTEVADSFFTEHVMDHEHAIGKAATKARLKDLLNNPQVKENADLEARIQELLTMADKDPLVSIANKTDYESKFIEAGKVLELDIGVKRQAVKGQAAVHQYRLDQIEKELNYTTEVSKRGRLKKEKATLEGQVRALGLAEWAGGTPTIQNLGADDYGWEGTYQPPKIRHAELEAAGKRMAEAEEAVVRGGLSPEVLSEEADMIAKAPLIESTEQDASLVSSDGCAYGGGSGMASGSDTGFFEGAWETTKDVAGGAVGGISAIGSFFSDFGTPLKQSLFMVTSAMAQYQYTRKGSKNSNTQLYRGLAMAMGASSNILGVSPDPLENFKRKPLAFEQLVANQDELLRRTLTIGGNPLNPAAYPNNIHDRLQSTLTQSGLGGFPSAAGGFSGIVSPNYQQFAAQAYNGYPPAPTLQTQGAILNMQIGNQNQFVAGRGLAALNYNTVPSQEGQQTLGNLLAATRAQKEGVLDFRKQLDQVNPMDNSIRSLIKSAQNIDERRNVLTQRQQNLNRALQSGSADFINSQLVLIHGLLNEEYRQLSNLNVQIFDETQAFRRLDLKVQNDEDGLMMGGPKAWSRNFEARNAALIRLMELRDERARILEKVALIRFDPNRYLRLIRNAPQVIEPETLPDQDNAPNDIAPPAAFLNLFQKKMSGFFVLRVATAAPKVQWVPQWKALLQTYQHETRVALEKENQKLKALLPKLKMVVQEDPDGVHELNMAVVEFESLNMKAIALQSRRNLAMLTLAEKDVQDSYKMNESQKQKIRERIRGFRFMLSEIEKEAKVAALELIKIEDLQTEKVTRYEVFHHYKARGEKLLKQYTPVP